MRPCWVAGTVSGRVLLHQGDHPVGVSQDDREDLLQLEADHADRVGGGAQELALPERQVEGHGVGVVGPGGHQGGAQPLGQGGDDAGSVGPGLRRQ